MNRKTLICMIVTIVSFVMLIVMNIAAIVSYLDVANGVTTISSFTGLINTLSRPMSWVSLSTYIWPISLLLQRIDHLNRWIKLVLLFAILFMNQILGGASNALSYLSTDAIYRGQALVGHWIGSLLCSHIAGALFATLYAAALRSLGFFSNKLQGGESPMQDDPSALSVASAPLMQPVSELEKYRQQMRNGGM